MRRATSSRLSLPTRLRRLAVLIRTEGGGPIHETAAIACGVFIGCLPLYGLHLLICGAVGTIFRLNRLKMYLAANLSNPFMAPLLVFLEIQAGGWLRRGSFHQVSVAAVKDTSAVTFGADLLIGSIAVGVVLAGLAGGLTYAVVRRKEQGDDFHELVRLASDRYIDAGLVAWEFARAKLNADPIYRACISGGLLTSVTDVDDPTGVDSGRTLLDLGCGQGLTLALLAEVRRAQGSGRWPPEWPALKFDHLVGVDIRERVVKIASAALAGDADVFLGDARTMAPRRVQAVLLIDVLHLMRREDQEAVLGAMARALDPGGLMVIREADAGAGWRFTVTQCGNRLKALAFGSWHQPFHFRTAAEWKSCMASHGLQAEVREMSQGTPFANILLLATRPSDSLPDEP